jgi:hypothetical protein
LEKLMAEGGKMVVTTLRGYASERDRTFYSDVRAAVRDYRSILELDK